jgi:predicted unusual protein kinase regulating ubiquinone biosynthesis (AarF/ABC1/UbiB family)
MSIRTAIQFSRIGIKTFALSKFDRDAGRKYLLRELGNLPGIPAKMGQVLTMRMGFDQDTDNQTPEPMPIEWVKEQIQSHCPDLASQIDSIDTKAITASLGQVHRVTLLSGAELAVKMRYPGIDQDLNDQLKTIIGTLRKLPTPEAFKINNDEYYEFLDHFFTEEIDYNQEAQTQIRFRKAWSNDFRYVIPAVHLEWSSESILVQDFEPSVPLHRIDHFSDREKAHYFEALYDFFIQGAFEHGLIHTDLHPKNWGFIREKAQMVFYDFGATLVLSTEIRLALLTLAKQEVHKPDQIVNLLETLGFDRKKILMIETELPQLMEILFEPVRKPKTWKPSNWNLQERINQLLGSKKWNFRTAGPPWFLMLIRGLNGWLHGMKNLEPNSESEPVYHYQTKLKVRVNENGVEKVFLELPATSVMDLDLFIPDTVKEKIVEQGISINDISERAIRNGYPPEILFESTGEGKHYKVWLE